MDCVTVGESNFYLSLVIYIQKHMNQIIYIIVLCFVILILSIINSLRTGRDNQKGGYIPSSVGPVDMLQQPKQLLMDGYRFQNSLFPRIEGDQRQLSDLCPTDRQRVGIFKEKAYFDNVSEPDTTKDLIGGAESPTAGSISQLMAKGEQDKYIYGQKGDPIVDSEKPFGMWVLYGSPDHKLEVNYPNEVYSWGDVINRYHGQISLR
jgi:hypothetical protein